MSRKVLYRKYRPTKLSDVVGQAQVTDALANSIKQGKIGHAYLFIGPRGTGKTSVARIFAHAVNDFDYQVEDSYLDIIEIDAASNTGVDNIRELREKAVIAPTSGKYKVYIIDEVHMLTKSASNALLKTLEEPPEHVIFIMATTDAHKVPITISSRTQVFTFRLASPEIMLAHLQQVAQQENIDITEDALKLVVRRGGGSFRDSMSLLDQVATLSDSTITAELLEQALGLPQAQATTQLLTSYAHGDLNNIRTQLQDLLNSGLKPETIASELISQIIAQPEPIFFSLLAKLPEVQPPFSEAKLLLALAEKVPITAPPTYQVTAQPVSTLPSAPEAPHPSAAAEQPAEPELAAASNPTPPSTPIASSFNPTGQKPANKIVTVPRPVSADAPDDQPILMPQPPSNPNEFDWEVFLDAVHSENGAVYHQLLKTDYELINTTLHLYPSQKFAKTVLEQPNHQQIMLHHLGNIALMLHEVGGKQLPKDDTLSKISDIMGDVREVNGDMPF